MMAQVIDLNPPPDTALRTICQSCSALIEYTVADFQSRPGTDRFGTLVRTESLTCPRCRLPAMQRWIYGSAR
jgi:hypothetical protein